jgi:Recombination endonuclease VII
MASKFSLDEIDKKEKRRQIQRAYYHRNKDKIKVRTKQRASTEKYKKYQREWHRKKHRPTPTRPEPLECECCFRPATTTLHLDHCHITNIFRGWLCASCNLGIGSLGDNIDGIKNALSYLEKAYGKD